MTTAKKTTTAGRQGFKTGEAVVYPAHGVGRITAIEEQEIAGYKLELFVVSFEKDKMVLRVPTAKANSVGMRKLAEPELVKKALDLLTGRARIKRTMWSRRAQEYEAKINSGDLLAVTEVVRDLYPLRGSARAVLFRAPALRGGPRPDRARDLLGQPHHRDRGPEAHRPEPREVAPPRQERGRGRGRGRDGRRRHPGGSRLRRSFLRYVRSKPGPLRPGFFVGGAGAVATSAGPLRPPRGWTRPRLRPCHLTAHAIVAGPLSHSGASGRNFRVLPSVVGCLASPLGRRLRAGPAGPAPQQHSTTRGRRDG